MLDINYIEQNYDEVVKRLNMRNQQDYSSDLKFVIEKNKKRKELLLKVEKIKAEKNQLSKQVGVFVREKKQDEAEQIKQQVSKMNSEIQVLDDELKITNEEMITKLQYIPNLPHKDITFGSDDNDNVEIRKSKHTKLVQHNTPHWEIATKLGLIDFERGTKLSGSRF